MATREQVLEAIAQVVQAGESAAESDAFIIRDVVVKELQVSLTVLSNNASVQSTLETALSAVLAPLGIDTIHARFRPLEERPEASQASVGNQTKQPDNAPGSTASEPVRGHGAGMEEHQLLHPDSGVQFIAVASGKGGVGKSTVTVNLAAALARKGKKVGIIDADIYGFSVPDMMGIEERPDILNDRVVPIRSHGVQVMSMGFFVEDNNPIVWRGPMLGKMLRNFFNEIAWDKLDYMLLDLPPGTGDIALDVHQMIPHSKEIIVTTPHATAAFVAARAGAMAIQTEHQIIGIVENMSYYTCGNCGEKDYIFGRGGGGRLAEALHADLLAQIPLGTPDNHPSEPDFSPSIFKENTPIGQLYIELAEQVIARCDSESAET
ncbi:Mrp/NBP35 family ATP-binding protein [Paenibacillus sp. GCM10012307]|uniref:Iron-sulfur cluster carrier protein n=1 Tax=Paenibacillus roseus TaxID=2798579 RepID=A0A934J687_9BACL|nr:Mrp/NBP35 family ATP-binding protein [Paenibacillus roseus]MBJ6361078.1 Mrp/NBP35 family ATP-binding protein [Paenibacillus roseus]